ncbi:DMT family transporter [Thermodesulfatator autotrophicus]|uniref:EamA domain-containing protein n=1 Tax=Thermodesulfatator autotrophicus TaxID=1795632 RepID=A0A177E7H2_9BACT|nr:DMT family transporter [Thermodesulfatator autotrophicus]OAG27182.1 hypothetical protein TH606_08205 [Thermodesulfatator autotrophicus]
MFWLILALNTALFTAFGDAFSKYFLRPFGTPSMVLARILGPTIIFLPLLFLYDWPTLSTDFWKTIAILYPLETVAIICYMEAIRISPLSLTVPYLAFTPAFIIVTGYLILGEKLTFTGIAGIFFIIAGSYCLNLSSIHKGISYPFKAMLKEKGSILMLLVAFIYAVTSVLLKVGIKQSETFFFALFYYTFLGLFVSAVIFGWQGKKPWQPFIEAPKGAMLVSLAQAVAVFSHIWAVSLAPVAYMIAIKRLSVLFGVIIGGLIFKEQAFKERLFGASLMVAGVFLIAWAGH